MAAGMAPCPDGFPAEVFVRLPALAEVFRLLFDCILRAGVAPSAMVEIRVLPLEKPGKGPTLAGSKRPISLICVMAKILGAVVLNRLTPALEHQVSLCQYALEMGRQRCIYLTSVAMSMVESGPTDSFLSQASA